MGDIDALQDTIHQSVLRLCVTQFVCRRLPQGMPVMREDAVAMAIEAREFLTTLFAEIENDDDSHQEKNSRQKTRLLGQKTRSPRRHQE